MAETFGSRLRRHRESVGIALSAIADQTKLKGSLLDALERDDLSHWPSGIFRRAWVRSYAGAVGLNPDEIVREFLAAHPEPEDAPDAAPPPPPAPWYRKALGGLFTGDRPADPIPAPALVTPVMPVAVEPPAPGPDLHGLARFCTEIGCAEAATDVPALLKEAALILNARGLIVWVWDHRAEALRPALVHGYAAKVVAQLPPVRRDDDNPTAAAFRSTQARELPCRDDGNAALVVPLLIPPRCAGVLAIELQPGIAFSESSRATAAIIAAAIAQLVARAKATQIQARLAVRLKGGAAAPSAS